MADIKLVKIRGIRLFCNQVSLQYYWFWISNSAVDTKLSWGTPCPWSKRTNRLNPTPTCLGRFSINLFYILVVFLLIHIAKLDHMLFPSQNIEQRNILFMKASRIHVSSRTWLKTWYPNIGLILIILSNVLKRGLVRAIGRVW